MPRVIHTVDEFWSLVDKSNECWRWIPGGKGNYFCYKGRSYKPARFAWELKFGLLRRAQLRQACTTDWCVNTDHYYRGDAPPAEKQCGQCSRTLPISQFYGNSQGYIASYCSTCAASKAKDWRLKNRELVRQRYDRNYYRGYVYKKRYGITLEEYNSLMKQQNQCCAICHVPFSLISSKNIHLDHSHSSGVVRGILCNDCNLAIGRAKDDTKILRSMIEYLEKAE